MGKEVRLMQGNEVVVEAAIMAGVKFFAGYPITPSSEIAEGFARRLPKVGGRFIQMEDEIASMAATIGASIGGAKSVTATSGPGFSLKQENLGFGIMTETPCLVVNVQRMGPSTGRPTKPSQGDMMQTRWGTHGDHPIIVYYPTTVPEIFTFTIKAINVSEKLRTPVILLMDETLGHMREKIEIPNPDEVEVVDRKIPDSKKEEYLPYKPLEDDVPVLAPFGMGYRYHITGLHHNYKGYPTTRPDEVEELTKRLSRKVEKALPDIFALNTYKYEDAEYIIFAYGITARIAKEAVNILRENGLKVGLINPITVWPFYDEKIRGLLEGMKKVFVVELNMGQMIREVERVYPREKVVGINKVNAELITPYEIANSIREGLK